MLFAFIGISVFGYSQDVKVNINNQDATVGDDCPYRINGICATEDIGGVDTEFKGDYASGYYWNNRIVFTNYNSFPVTVLWKVDYTGNKSYSGKTGSIVIGVEGVKEVQLNDYYGNWSLSGLIVRKLAQ